MGIEIVMNNKLISNQKFKITIVMMKDIMLETRKGFDGRKLLDQVLKPLFMMHTKR